MNFTKDASSGQEGFDWLQRILTTDPDAVVLFITAYGDAENFNMAKELGADDFLTKPVDFVSLKEKLREKLLLP